MTLAFPRTAGGAFRQVRAYYILAGALIVVIAVGVGLGVWQLSEGGASSAPTLNRPALKAAPPARHIVYLVSSEAQADAVIAAEDEAAYIRSQFGDFDTYDRVEVVVVSEGGLGDTGVRFVNENQFLNDLGVPEVTLVDLRELAR